MISDSWICNLASWRWDSSKQEWDHPPIPSLDSITESVAKLIELTQKSCSDFNRYSTTDRQMRYMGGSVDYMQSFDSFALLLGRCDARLKLVDHNLTVAIATAEGYSRTITYSQGFTAHGGNLAQVLWKRSDGFLYTEELISMLMLEELVKTWWNYQGLGTEQTKSGKDDAREYQL